MKKKYKKRLSKKAGLPPGTPVHIGKENASVVQVEMVVYNEESVELKKLSSINECAKFVGNGNRCWIHIDGVHDMEMLAQAGEIFGLHPLVLEDIANTQQRPKFEDMGDYLFFTLKHLVCENEEAEIEYEQVSFVMGENFVFSFSEKPGELFYNIRERLVSGVSKALARRTDYLVYLLIDATVDSYYEIIEKLEDRIEGMEDNVINEQKGFALVEMQAARRDLALLLKAVFPLREAIGKILRRESKLIQESSIVFFSDVYDHAIHIIESIESQRDILSGLMDIYLSATSNRTNSAMKVLTIIATIFIPLTFLAGIYGMNFKNIPELSWKWGYLFFWILCVLCTFLMLVYFRKKKWL